MSAHRYLVTARKYRPKLFRELVAQEHVTETLENALQLDRLAHAYLFSGPRGVGKTTAARILAKAINCTTPLEERDGAEPCRTCDSCQSFEEGRSLNIIEIDAASNNKVDDIRELRESVRIPPQGSRKKVYIVDEVHMLSNAAFNALLKTLEEPPPHVLFIFATTEPNKVLPTILSRCQRFDFRRIPVPEIVAHLRGICEAEDITADDASLLLLARKGDGALRDALSAFDQAISLCGTDLQYAELARAMGVVEIDLFFEVTDAVRDRDSAAMLRLVERVVRAGYDLQEFLVGLAEHLRNVLVARTMQDATLVEATEAVRQRYLGTAADFAEPDLLRLLTVVDDAHEAVRTSAQPRLKLELALLKMASLAGAADLRTVMQQLDRLEKMADEGKLPAALAESAPAEQPAAASTADERAANGAAEAGTPDEAPTAADATPTEQPAAPSNGTAAAPNAYPTPEAGGVVSEAAAPAPANREAAPSAPADASSDADGTPDEPDEAPEADEPDEPDERPLQDDDREGGVPEPVEPSGPPEPAPASSGTTSESTRRSAYADLFGKPALKKKKGDAPTAHADGAPSGDGAVAPPAAPPGDESDAATSQNDHRVVMQVWPDCLQKVLERSKPVGSCMRDAEVTGVKGSRLVLQVPSSFHRQQLTGNQEMLLEPVRRASGLDVTFLDVKVVRTQSATGSADTSGDDRNPKDVLQTAREQNPALDALCDEFGVEIVW